MVANFHKPLSIAEKASVANDERCLLRSHPGCIDLRPFPKIYSPLDNMPEPQSDQERLMHRLGQWALGGPHVFLPEHWRSGTSNNQPADLVWVCNDCVILMYMCSVDPRGDVTKVKAKFEKAKRHNASQAKGCLRRWKDGADIRGTAENIIENIDHVVTANSIAHVVVLSVVQSGATVVEVDEELARELGVTLFATIPEQTLVRLTSYGGGVIDLILVLGELANRGVMSEEEFDRLCASYVVTCRNLTKCTELWRSCQEPAFRELMDPFSRMRHASPSNQGHALIDISIIDLYKMMRAIHMVIKKNNDAYSRSKSFYADMTLCLSAYDFHFFIGNLKVPAAKQAFRSHIDRVMKKCSHTPHLAIMLCTMTGMYFSLSDSLRKPTHLRQLLDTPRKNWAELFAARNVPFE